MSVTIVVLFTEQVYHLFSGGLLDLGFLLLIGVSGFGLQCNGCFLSVPFFRCWLSLTS